jgi:hypothetical protein
VLPGYTCDREAHKRAPSNRRKDAMKGREFKRALRQVGLTVYSAAPFLGLSLSTAYRIARGEYDAPESAAKLLRLMVKLNLKAEDVP